MAVSGRRIGEQQLSHPLLERGHELDQLDGLLQVASVGRGAAAALVGPAGIGKTSLVRAASQMARDRGFACLHARGGEFERGFAYGIVRQLLERPLADLPAAHRRSVLHGAARVAGEIVGVSAAQPPMATDAFAAVHSLFWVCANLASRQPLLLAVDDLHWADEPSLRFLSYMARRVEDLPVLLLMAARPAPIDERADLVQAVTRGLDAQTIAPAPLSRSAVGEMIRSLLGEERADDPDLVESCWTTSGGNPFLCSVLIQALASRGANAAPVSATEAAADVSALILARLGRLPRNATQLARAIAILGTDADLRHAAALSGLDLETAARTADALAAQDILAIGRPLEFVHPLVRTVVAAEMPTASRMLAHARAAAIIHDAGASPLAVATHLIDTGPGGDPWVVQRLREAAEMAAGQGAPGTARTYLHRALEEPPRQEQRAGLLRQLGRAALQSGAGDDAVRHLEDALRASDRVTERVGIALELVGALTVQGGYTSGADLIFEMLDEVRGLGDGPELLLLANLMQMAMLEPFLNERAERLLAELRPADRAQRPPEYHAALVTRAALGRRPSYAEVRSAAERAREAGLTRLLASGGISWTNTVYPLICADGFAPAAAIVDEGLAVRPHGGSLVAVRAYGARAMLQLRQGRIREATADARTAVETGREAGFHVWVLALATLIEALTDLGDVAGAQHELDVADLDEEIPDGFLHNWVLGARGQLRLEQHRVQDAVADLTKLRRRHERRHHRNPAIASCGSRLAVALLRSGDRDEALTVAHSEYEDARSWGAPRAIGIAERVLGLVKGNSRGRVLLQTSVDTLARSEARLELARSLAELGAALRRAGERSASRPHLQAAMELAHECGATPLVQRAREELLASGARPRRVMRTGVDALTPSELRVARMAADGMSNRDIAQALFVTLRTVEVHLTHAYQKLDVKTRRELPPALTARRA